MSNCEIFNEKNKKSLKINPIIDIGFSHGLAMSTNNAKFLGLDLDRFYIVDVNAFTNEFEDNCILEKVAY